MFYYISTNCSTNTFDLLLDQVRLLRVVFEQDLYKQWLVYLLVVLVSDYYLLTTKLGFVFKQTLVVPLLYVPFLAMVIWFNTEYSYIKTIADSDCLL